ncbi:membrane bound O-acyl transferase family-domain-containing protein [Calycina marina]|uniref:Membrane bound O-acyl transferase family-domain-containing protein n=1 Tax=Calycina marina TaxID=1763456 RepID=A0A9P7Z074_9HELO|nr:membrane bound O-acyl transferase family-domain-containing protein [Calycina marina]
MIASSAMTYTEAEQIIRNRHFAAYNAGNVISSSSPVANLNLAMLIGWLMVCPSLSESTFCSSRLPVFLSIAAASTWNLLYIRSIGIVGSIGVGLSSSFFTIVALNFTLLHDPRKFARVVMRSKAIVKQGEVIQSWDERKSLYMWESVPRFGWRRLMWVLDLLTAMRVAHWTWKQPAPLPAFCSLPPDHNAGHFLGNNVLRFAINCFLFDAIKCSMIADPFYIGFGTITESPPPFLEPYLSSFILVYVYRTMFALFGGFIAIDMNFTLAKMMQVNVLGSAVVGLNAYESTFQPLWGSPRAILDKGLRGFWGDTWHQMLRMHLLSVGDAVADRILGRVSDATPAIDPRRSSSQYRTKIRVWTVFILSGALHMAASYTLPGPSKPWTSFLFFAIQPIAMSVQHEFSERFSLMVLANFSRVWHKPIVRTANLLSTILWMMICSPLMLNDLTTGGIWTLEPLPISVIRGFGWSDQDKGFWVWSPHLYGP